MLTKWMEIKCRGEPVLLELVLGEEEPAVVSSKLQRTSFAFRPFR